MNLVIDIGNTRVKAAVFENTSLLELLVFEEEHLLKKIIFFLKKYRIEAGIISSVKQMSPEIWSSVLKKLPFVELNAATKVPFVNLYETPNTLGVDRIALVSNASIKFPKKNVLVIDAGTCITYDFINCNNEYLGGAISLGVEMRYKSLYQFTSKLPLLEKNENVELVGSTTSKSIQSGVNNGVVAEINGVIAQYEKEMGDLTVVLTGGDTYFLAKQLKSSIFANPNFVLEGLNTILIYNKTEC